MCEVNARSQDQHFRRQESCVKTKTLDPEWDEVFELPVAAAPGYLEAALDRAAPGGIMQQVLTAEVLEGLLPPEGEGFHSLPAEKTSAAKNSGVFANFARG